MPKDKSKQELFKRIALYDEIERDSIAGIEEYGLCFSRVLVDQEQRTKRIEKLKTLGASVSPGGYSVYTAKRSSACEVCRHGVGSFSLPLTMKCNKACYFCFNPNQEDYENQRERVIEWKPMLSDIADQQYRLSHLAVTGGEPLLFPDESVRCIEYARQRFAGIHTRLYTNGTPLDTAMFKRLKKAGLDEIRFSIKLDEGRASIDKSLELIQEARNYIPSVLVEMPVIPGTLDAIKELLCSLNDAGIFGINLLEFCYPMFNAEAYAKRGFLLKNPPFKVLYNYWYSGGFAVAESEELSFDLIEYALEKKLSMSVHYCSLENKNTGQMFQQNKPFEKAYPQYHFSTVDFFLKTLLLFDEAALRARNLLKENNVQADKYHYSKGNIRIHPSLIGFLADKRASFSGVTGLSYNVVEIQDGEPVLRELKVTRHKVAENGTNTRCSLLF